MSATRTVKRTEDLGRLRRRVDLMKDPNNQAVSDVQSSLPQDGQVKNFSPRESKSSSSQPEIDPNIGKPDISERANRVIQTPEFSGSTNFVIANDSLIESSDDRTIGVVERTNAISADSGSTDATLLCRDGEPRLGETRNLEGMPVAVTNESILGSTEVTTVHRPESPKERNLDKIIAVDSAESLEPVLDRAQGPSSEARRGISTRSQDNRGIESSKTLNVYADKRVNGDDSSLLSTPVGVALLNFVSSELPNIDIILPRLTKRREGRVYHPRPEAIPGEEKFERGYKITYEQNNMLMAIRRKWQTPRSPITFSAICTVAIRRYLSLLQGELKPNKLVEQRVLGAVIVGKVKQSVMMTAEDLDSIGKLHQQLRMIEPKLDISAIVGWSIEELYWASENGSIDGTIFRKYKSGRATTVAGE